MINSEVEDQQETAIQSTGAMQRDAEGDVDEYNANEQEQKMGIISIRTPQQTQQVKGSTKSGQVQSSMNINDDGQATENIMSDFALQDQDRDA